MKKFLLLVVLLIIVALSITACKSITRNTSVPNFEKNFTTTDMSVTI